MSDELTPSSGKQPNQNLHLDQEFEQMVKTHRTIGEFIKAYFKPVYFRIPVFAQGPTPEADKARFERIFRPWPKWVLRLAAELRHIDFPTIDRELFYQTFRVINILVFRISINPSAETMPVTKRDLTERIDIDVLPLIMSSILGHGIEHLEACRKKLDEQLFKGEISPDEHARQMKMLSPDECDKLFRQFLSSWSADDKFKPYEMTRTVEEARRKTFDKHGRSRVTALTPVYRKMFRNWIKIENMSGPKELTHFLLADKGNADFYAEYDRVKKMCSRLGIKFSKSVNNI